MAFVALVASALWGVLAVQVVAYIYALKLSRVDVIDVAWGISFIAGIAAMQLARPSFAPVVLLVDGLVVVWGARLASHIYRRFRRSSTQDKRYSNLLRTWPKQHWKLQLFGRLFLVQALLATTISLPVIVTHYYQPPLSPLIGFAVCLWVAGYVCEHVADTQLRRFLSERVRDNQLMTQGLWRFSRHPNYFGEIVMWWAIALFGIMTPLWFVGIVGAATITTLICFVSGIPLAEKQAAQKPGWQSYKRRTSILLPWPPAR